MTLSRATHEHGLHEALARLKERRQVLSWSRRSDWRSFTHRLSHKVLRIEEAGYRGYDAGTWYGLFAPAGTPPAIIARLNKEMVALGKNPEHREQLAKQGQEAVYSTPEELARYTKSESDKWARVIKTAKIEADK